jgi:hypothetical protein
MVQSPLEITAIYRNGGRRSTSRIIPTAHSYRLSAYLNPLWESGYIIVNPGGIPVTVSATLTSLDGTIADEVDLMLEIGEQQFLFLGESFSGIGNRFVGNVTFSSSEIFAVQGFIEYANGSVIQVPVFISEEAE